LRRDPAIEVTARLYHYPKQHHRMLSAAKLGTLTEVSSGNVWIYPHGVLLIGNYVGLAGQARNPEAVRDVGGLEIQKGRRWSREIAHRHVKLVRGSNAENRVTEFPPPLMPDDAHAQSTRWLRPRLNDVNDTSSGKEQDEYNEDRNRGPCEFNRVAAVDLRRFAAVIAGAGSKSHDAVGEQACHDQKNYGGDRENKERDGIDLLSWGGDRLEYAARRNFRV